jgi:hypothetical protein
LRCETAATSSRFRLTRVRVSRAPGEHAANVENVVGIGISGSIALGQAEPVTNGETVGQVGVAADRESTLHIRRSGKVLQGENVQRLAGEAKVSEWDE